MATMMETYLAAPLADLASPLAVPASPASGLPRRCSLGPGPPLILVEGAGRAPVVAVLALHRNSAGRMVATKAPLMVATS